MNRIVLRIKKNIAVVAAKNISRSFFKDSPYLRSIKKREFKQAFKYLTMWLSYLLYLKRKGPIRTNLTCFTFVLTNFTGGGYKLNIFFSLKNSMWFYVCL